MALPDSATYDTYGGAKTNYAPVEDYSTDEDAADRNEYVADVAGMTHTAVRCWRRFLGNAVTPTDPGSNVFDNVWGNDLADKPTVARTGAGVYTVTYPATIVDDNGTTRSINLRGGWANVEGSTLYFTTVTVTSPNVLTVRVFNTAFAANDAAGVTIAVFAV
jgi:hypothetical protein